MVMNNDFGTRWKERWGSRNPTSIFADYGTPKMGGEYRHQSAAAWGDGGEEEMEKGRRVEP